MVKTNSKIARDNIRAYISSNFGAWVLEDQGKKTPVDFSGIASAIYADYKRYISNDNYYHGRENADTFFEYTSILPSILECDFRLCQAKPILMNILQETEQEAEKFSETQAEKLLSDLIYREICKAIGK